MSFCLDVSGEFACFTRPEMKVERVSYDVITPSSARAIFEAILWKPAIHWQVTKIEVLNPIKWMNLRRNEVESIVSTRTAKSASRGGGRPAPRRRPGCGSAPSPSVARGRDRLRTRGCRRQRTA